MAPKSFSCNSCDKSYTQSHSLKNHQLVVHEGFRLNCDSCDRSFTQSPSLQKHKKSVHKDIKIEPKPILERSISEKKYECDLCDKIFTQSGSLKRHKETLHRNNEQEPILTPNNIKIEPKTDLERSNKPEKSFKCGKCDKCFTQSGSLKRHIENLHRNTELQQISTLARIQKTLKEELFEDKITDPDENVQNSTKSIPDEIIAKNQTQSVGNEPDDDEHNSDQDDQNKLIIVESDESDHPSEVFVESAADEPDQDEPEQDEPDKDEPEQDDTDQDDTDQDDTDQDEPEQDEPEQEEPEQDEPEQEELDQDEREQDELFEIRTQPLDQGEPKQFNPKHDKLVIDESNQMETDEKAKSVLHKVLDQKPRKKFECKLCNRGYTQGGSLTRHIKNMHTNADKEGLKKSEKNPKESNTIEHKAPKGIKIERNDNEEEDVRENISENDQDSTLENVFKKNTNANSVVKISGGTLVKKIKEENSHQPNSTVRKIDIEKQYSAKIENQPKHEPIVNIKKEHWENTIQNSSAKKIGSIYQLQFFICPSCSFKNKDKQDLVNHICEAHPEVVDDLKEISDGSLSDVICPWKNDENDALIVRKVHTDEITNNDENSDESETDDQNESDEDEEDQERSKNSISGEKSDFLRESKNQNESEENETDQEESDVEEIDDDEPIEILEGNSNVLFVDEKKSNSENFTFTPDEADRLETFFRNKKHINTFEIEKLCKNGNFPEDKVREWFEMKKRIISANPEFENDIIATDIEIDNFINDVEIKVKKSLGSGNNDEKTSMNVGSNNKKRKSYPCESCDKTYTQSHSLKTHVSKVHVGLDSSTDFGIKKRKTTLVASSPPEEFNSWIEDLNKTKNYDDNNAVHKGHFLAHQYIANVEDDPKNPTFGDNNEKSTTTIKLEKNDDDDENRSEIFSCPSCDKSYTRSQILRRHIKNVHEGIKEYSCQSCDKSYTQSHNLKTHIQKVHKGLKLPRASAGIKNEFQITNSEKKFEFTPDEVDRLETFFRAKKHINTFEIENLAKHGNFPEEKVQEWFENRRLNTLGKSELLDRYITM